MFGQFPVWVFGVVVPGAVLPPAPVDGCVVAFGAGEPDGSAARTTAVPPTASRPTTSATVATVRRRPPSADVETGSVHPDGAGSSGGSWAGSQAPWPAAPALLSFQSMLVLLWEDLV
jgi:hypothetical protein